MPYQFNNKKIPPEEDKRRKLMPEDKELIRLEYKHNPDASQRSLARKYDVSRRLIQFVLDPEKEKRNKELYKERRKDGRYYDKEKHTDQMRKHRRRKKELRDKGKLESNTSS